MRFPTFRRLEQERDDVVPLAQVAEGQGPAPVEPVPGDAAENDRLDAHRRRSLLQRGTAAELVF